MKLEDYLKDNAELLLVIDKQQRAINALVFKLEEVSGQLYPIAEELRVYKQITAFREVNENKKRKVR